MTGLPKAFEARRRSLLNSAEQDAEVIASQRSALYKAIDRAINNGDLFTWFTGKLLPSVRRDLIDSGYMVEAHRGKQKISW